MATAPVATVTMKESGLMRRLRMLANHADFGACHESLAPEARPMHPGGSSESAALALFPVR
jgi:hypothetical protein